MIELKEANFYNTQIITKACLDAMKRKKMVGIVDYAGAGKSYALKKFANENIGVYIVELGLSTPPKEMYVEILNQIRGEDISRSESISNIKRQIRLELQESTGNNLIIIDEASRYEKEKVSYFHELRNMTQTHSGLIISGHKDFENMLFKWISKGIKGVEEFQSRFSYIIQLARPTIKEVTEFFKVNNLLSTEKERSLYKEITQMNRDKLNFRLIRNLISEHLNK